MHWLVPISSLTLLIAVALAGCGSGGGADNGSGVGGSAGSSSSAQAGGQAEGGQSPEEAGGAATSGGAAGADDASAGADDGGAGADNGGAGTAGNPVLHADTVAPQSVVAGDAVNVTCLLLDDNGDTHPPGAGVTPSVEYAPAGSVQIGSNGVVTAARAGTVKVTCSFPVLALTDTTPATMTIVAGAATALQTTLDQTQVVAGGSVTATCAASDAFGNPVSAASATLGLTPTDGGNSTSGLSATLTKAGAYEVSCALPGATGPGAPLTVVPALPAAIVVSRSPDAPSYPLGATVEVLATVSDKYGNVIDGAALEYESVPTATTATVDPGGPQFFQYQTGGDGFVISATVSGPTDGNASVTASTTPFDIQGTGPTITCDSSVADVMVNQAPGATLAVHGSWQDANAVTSVTVNGTSVATDSGQFSVPLTTRFGLNFADVVVTDEFGQRASQTCTWLESSQWAVENSAFADTVSLKLTQLAVDDGQRTGALNSLADVLYAVVNSSGPGTTLDSALKADNPLKPDSCDEQTCILGSCICFSDSGITYVGLQLGSPNTTTLTLVNGGLSASVHFADVKLNLEVVGDTVVVPYDKTGSVDYAGLDVGFTLDLTLQAGRPHVALRANSISTTMGAATTNFPGLDASVVTNVVVPLASGSLSQAVQVSLTNYTTSTSSTALDGIVSGLDISTLGSSFNVPNLDGVGSLPVSFGVSFSSLSATASRALFGIGSQFSAPAANAYPSLGVAIPTGTVLNDPSVSSPASTAVSEHIGLFNQALHALWRANWLDKTLDGSTLSSGAPAGTQVTIKALLPPVANMAPYGSNSPTAVELSLGALSVEVVYPGLFEASAPFQGEVGARVSGAATLSGNDLHFGALAISEQHVNDASLSDSDRATLEALLSALVLQVANASLNDSLPALPIPTFSVPSSLSQFGLSAGTQLGCTSPALSYAPRYFQLLGGFGQR